MKIDSLKKLYIDELKDIYSAEKQITEALPKMISKTKNEKLKKAFEDHLKMTENQIQRIEEIFSNKKESPSGKKCKGMESIIEEGEEMMKEITDPEVLDAALIAAAQKVEHYEIASYGTVRTYAEILGDEDSRELLQQTLDEEKQTDLKLTELAVNSINIEANQ